MVYAVVSILLMVVVYLALQINPAMAFGAVVGSTAFFITHGLNRMLNRAKKVNAKGVCRILVKFSI